MKADQRKMCGIGITSYLVTALIMFQSSAANSLHTPNMPSDIYKTVLDLKWTSQLKEDPEVNMNAVWKLSKHFLL